MSYPENRVQNLTVLVFLKYVRSTGMRELTSNSLCIQFLVLILISKLNTALGPMLKVSVSLPIYDHYNQKQWGLFASKPYISKSGDKSRMFSL